MSGTGAVEVKTSDSLSEECQNLICLLLQFPYVVILGFYKPVEKGSAKSIVRIELFRTYISTISLKPGF